MLIQNTFNALLYKQMMLETRTWQQMPESFYDLSFIIMRRRKKGATLKPAFAARSENVWLQQS